GALQGLVDEGDGDRLQQSDHAQQRREHAREAAEVAPQQVEREQPHLDEDQERRAQRHPVRAQDVGVGLRKSGDHEPPVPREHRDRGQQEVDADQPSHRDASGAQ
ncbi:MAG: hypothetical protein ACK559_27255, partial [bacterium]